MAGVCYDVMFSDCIMCLYISLMQCFGLNNVWPSDWQVVTLTKKQERPGAKAMKSLAKRPEDASADAAAAAAPQAAWKPAAAHRSTLAPVEAPSAAPSIEPSKVFQVKQTLVIAQCPLSVLLL